VSPVTPTPVRLLAALAAIAAAIAATLANLSGALTSRLLPVPASPIPACLLIALGIAIWALLLRSRFAAHRSWAEGRRGPGSRPAPPPVPPLLAARSLALALAASRVGALVLGSYLGLAVMFLGEWQLPAGRERVVLAVAGLLGGLTLSAAALWLERVLRVPPTPGETVGGLT